MNLWGRNIRQDGCNSSRPTSLLPSCFKTNEGTMRFTTLCLLIAACIIGLSLNSSSDAGDVREVEVEQVKQTAVSAPLFQRTRSRTVNVEVSETAAPVQAQCGPNGCSTVRSRVVESIRQPRSRNGLLSRLRNRSSRRTVSVSRGLSR